MSTPEGMSGPQSAIFRTEETFQPTVLHWRPFHEWSDARGRVLRGDATIAEGLLGFMRDTAEARNDEKRLLDVIADCAFRIFPGATHQMLLARDERTGLLQPLIARARHVETVPVLASRTIVDRVMNEGGALLYVHDQGEFDASKSIMLTRMETAICAPLMDSRAPFGVIQMDVRRPVRGRFTREDVDLLSVFAGQVGLAIEHLRMFQQQRRAFESTIHALLQSLTLKDPECARHSERVQALSLEIGRQLGFAEVDLEVLGVAALLHDLGKQGVRDEVLFKADRLTDEEREEMGLHAAHTQTILDQIVYPVELRDVPRIAAYHHEKLDGTGPFRISGSDIPLAARVIAVADVFDALLSPRVYKEPLPLPRVLEILARGKGVDWDARIVDLVAHGADLLMEHVYGQDDEESGLDQQAA